MSAEIPMLAPSWVMLRHKQYGPPTLNRGVCLVGTVPPPRSLPLGAGRVAGTVQKQGEPNVAVARRVRLMRFAALDNSAPAAIETWSDPVTGEYVFTGLALGVAFAVCSFDHTGEHNAVIAAPIYAEPMP